MKKAALKYFLEFLLEGVIKVNVRKGKVFVTVQDTEVEAGVVED